MNADVFAPDVALRESFVTGPDDPDDAEPVLGADIYGRWADDEQHADTGTTSHSAGQS